MSHLNKTETRIIISIILLLFIEFACEKISNETDPQKIIIGKWKLIEMGNGSNLVTVDQPGGYDEYLHDSVKIEYSYYPPESTQKNYWIDSLLHERIFFPEEMRYVNTGVFKFDFFDKNQRMRLDYARGISEFSTFIYKRIK
jgi:hypothetical protein